MLTPAELIAIKNKVKAEMLRRNRYGSISYLGGIAYDFTVPPTSGGAILSEHGKKLIDPLLAIADYGDLTLVKKDDSVPDYFSSEISAYVDRLASESMTGNSSSCRGACTGLCVGTCATGCIGCTGTCNGCQGTCSGQCDTGCTNCTGCFAGCANGCNGCTATCGAGCASSARSAL